MFISKKNREVAENIWKNCKMAFKLSDEPRAGFYECGMLLSPDELLGYIPVLAERRENLDEQQLAFLKRLLRSESVCEHSYSCSNLVSEMLMWYPDIVRGYSPLTLIKTMQIHDIAEIVLHDISDNGSLAHENKREKERKIFKQYAYRLPPGYRECVDSLFLEMDECSTDEGMFLKATDKTDAVLRLLACENMGLYGNVFRRDNITKQDLKHAIIVGTGNCTDVWGYHLYEVCREFPDEILNPFAHLLYVAATDVRGKPFEWWPA